MEKEGWDQAIQYYYPLWNIYHMLQGLASENARKNDELKNKESGKKSRKKVLYDKMTTTD